MPTPSRRPSTRLRPRLRPARPALAALFLLPALLMPAATAAPLDPARVPAALAPWVDWVLGDADPRGCALDADGAARCAWPGRLRMTLTADGGRFEQGWRLAAPGWVALPGDTAVWPQDTLVDGAPIPVVERDGRPMVWLGVGEHRLSGRFVWPRRPDGLALPPATALLGLTVDGNVVASPRVDADGRLWLAAAAGPTGTDPDDRPATGDPDALALEVTRRIDDGAPLLVTTRLALDVAGQPRELRLGPAVLAGGIPLSLTSPLPTRLDEQGHLIVQARPGRWTLTLVTRHPGPVERLDLGTAAAPWPAQEAWVFQADPALRQVEVKGADAVDPTQTRLPPEWQRLPAWLLTPGQGLVFDTLQRGAVAADRLRLDRELRLDFDGRGFSLRDHISGQLEQRWRLSALAPIALGQVQVDGAPRLITRLPAGADADAGEQTGEPPAAAVEAEAGARTVEATAEGGGIEVRQGTLQLLADARIDTPDHASSVAFGTRLPAAGWALDLDAVDISLHLPAGWDLLAVEGVDNLPGSWLARWSLLDIFLVLIAATAIGRLWGWPWGLVALAGLVLTWTEPGAPRLIWLHVLVGAALLRVLPRASGRPVFDALHTVVAVYYRLALLLLAVIAVPFIVAEVRDGLYPQLDRPADFPGGLRGVADAGLAGAPPPAPRVASPSASQSAAESLYDRVEAYEERREKSLVSARPLPTLDPNARVQTGLGVPQWDWQRFDLRLNGPVAPEQSIRLWLLPPALALPLAVLRVVLVLLLGLRLADLLRPPAPGAATPTTPDGHPDRQVLPAFGRTPSALAGVGLLLGALALLAPPPTLAQPGGDAAGFDAIDAGDAGDAGAAAPGVPRPGVAGDFPPPALLDDLRARLLAPPDCLPGCATIALLRVETDTADLRLGLVVDALVPVALPVPGAADGWRPTWLALDEAPLDALARSADGTLLVPVPAGRHGLLLRGPLPASGALELPLPLRPRLVIADIPAPWRLDGVAPNGQPGDQLRLAREVTPDAIPDSAPDLSPAALTGGDRPDGDAATPAPPAADDVAATLPPLLKVTRTLRLGLDWTLTTEVERLSPSNQPVSLWVALLPGEAVTTPERQVADGRLLVTLPPGRDADGWSATLTPVDTLTLQASTEPTLTEEWRIEASPLWHLTTTGIPPIQAPAGGRRVPTWRPWPGETLRLDSLRPIALPGPTLTLDGSRYAVTPGRRGTDANLSLTLRASQGGRHRIALPAGAELTALNVDGEPRPQVLQAGAVDLALTPGSQRVEIGWREPAPIATRWRPAPVDLGVAGVNAEVAVSPAPDRWVLWTGGPPHALGPAVLFWPLLAALALLAFALARLRLTPLGFRDWLLLGVGLSQAGIWSAALVTLWLFALGLRRRLGPDTARWQFNLAQVALVLLSIAALIALIAAVEQGLLGAPAMQIAGNDSGPGLLQWYQDRAAGLTPTVTVWSVPVWVYRLLMLAWALWLALRLLAWLRWGWQGFAEPTLWRERPPGDKPTKGQRPAVGADQEPLSVDL